MAKGDHSRMQNQVDYSTGVAQNRLDNTQRILDRQNLGFEQNYNAGVSRNLNDYDSIMNQYRTFLSGNPMGGQPPSSTGYVPTQGTGNYAPNPALSLQGAPHATNPNNQPGEGTAIPRNGIPETVPTTTTTAPSNTPTAQAPATGAAAFIKNWQATHPGEVNKQSLLTALQQAGFNAQDYKYGDVSSGNEITLDGQKYKVIANENSANPTWYEAGTDDSAPGGNLVNPLAGYSDFARTGGFSPMDISNIRAQSIAPIRGLYSAGMDEVNRQGKMGNAPNKVAALAKMAREGAYATSDATTNAEANIARLIQSGKLAGLGGLQSGILGALSGQTGLYGSTPGMASTFGNQVLSSTGQQLTGNQLQNEIARLRLTGQQNVSQTPGDFDVAMGKIAQILQLVGAGANAASGVGNLFNKAPLPSTRVSPVGSLPIGSSPQGM